MRFPPSVPILVLTALLALMLTACSPAAPVAVAPDPAASSTTVAQPTSIATATPTVLPPAMATTEPSPTSAPTAMEAPPPTESPTVDPLTAAFATPAQAAGQVIVLTGRVLDTAGEPLAGATVEIWQTDANGIYDHPGDPNTDRRDRSFQFYGQSTVDATGTFLFRTILPGEYEPRPRHIHAKVKRDGATLLTTQFYFDENLEALQREGIFRQAGDEGDLLILRTIDQVDGPSGPTPVLTNDLVIDTGAAAGVLAPTPAQAEGPYYPAASIADFDNDLAVVP